MSIEWTEESWNPFAGCSKISPGCKHCYAIGEAVRMHTTKPKYLGTVVGKPKSNWTGRINFDPSTLRLPYSWRTPQRIFVNSMSDLFHEKVPFEWLQQVFAVMNDCPQHQFQILTKRSDILRAVAPRLTWTPNIWMGVSVENAEYTFRIDDLRTSPAAIKWISAEPLLGPLDGLDLRGIHWVVTGGLSGGDAPKKPQDTELVDWVRSIRDQCRTAGVAFFFKQWGGPRTVKKANGKLLDGREWMEYPVPNSYVVQAPSALDNDKGRKLDESRTASEPASGGGADEMPTDPAPLRRQAAVALHRRRNGSKRDIVMTPRWFAKRIIDYFPLKGFVLDPCKGEGAFYDQYPADVKKDWCEVRESRDFFDWHEPVDWIVSNTPWSGHAFTAFLAHSLELADNVALLIPSAMGLTTKKRIRIASQFGQGLKEIVFYDWPPEWNQYAFTLTVHHWQRGWTGGAKLTNLMTHPKLAA